MCPYFFLIEEKQKRQVFGNTQAKFSLTQRRALLSKIQSASEA
jgi:hypothetical protein